MFKSAEALVFSSVAILLTIENAFKPSIYLFASGSPQYFFFAEALFFVAQKL